MPKKEKIVKDKVKVEDAKYWARRKRSDKRLDWRLGELDWIGGYRLSVDHPHRQLILDALKTFVPFAGVLEIGCNAGPNLTRIRDVYPETQLAGIDVNKDVVEVAQQVLPGAMIREGNVSNIPFNERMFDVVILDAVLLYVGPKEIYQAFQEINRMARRGVIIVDWFAESERGVIREHHWARDYNKLLESVGFTAIDIKLKKEDWPNDAWVKNGRIFIGTRA